MQTSKKWDHTKSLGWKEKDFSKWRIFGGKRGDGNKVRKSKKIIREMKQKFLVQGLLEKLFVQKKVDVKTMTTNYEKLSVSTHLDVGGCVDNFKTILQCYAILNKKVRRLKDEWQFGSLRRLKKRFWEETISVNNQVVLISHSKKN